MYAEAFESETQSTSVNYVPIRFPVDAENPMALVDFTTVQLAQLSTPDEIARAFTAFIEPEVIEFIDKSPESYYLLGVVWLNAMRRMMTEFQPHEFPYELLSLPVLFQRWDWQYTMSSDWRTLYQELQSYARTLPANTESHIHVGVELFCLEAIFTQETPAPFDAMNTRLSERLPQPQFMDAILSMGMILGRNGWVAGC